MAKSAPAPKTPANVASMDPDSYVEGGGLATNFDGTVLKARVEGWDFNGTKQEQTLAVSVTVRPDDAEDDDPDVVEHLLAGDLSNFVPSNDGETPESEEQEGGIIKYGEGVYFMKVGSKDGLPKHSSWAQFVRTAIEGGFPKDKLSADIRWIEGAHGHFDRVPQEQRPGGAVKLNPKTGRPYDILVMSKFLGARSAAPKAAASGSKASGSSPAAAKPASSAKPTGGNDLTEKLQQVVINATAGQAVVKKAAIAGLVVKDTSFSPADRAKAVKLLTPDFFENAPEVNDAPAWLFDPETGEITGLVE